MPFQMDKNAQAWMGTQVAEMLRRMQKEESQSMQSEIKSVTKKYEK